MRIKIHSIVDVITNSSTTIFTYQNSINEAKELVAEMLKLMGSDETPDDVFYYGLFYEDWYYLDRAEDDGIVEEGKSKKDWLLNLKKDIMSGKVERPKWMDYESELDGEGLADHLYLELIPKDEKYKELGERIERLLCSVDGVESCT